MDFVSRVYEFEGAGQALIEKLELEVATIRLIGRDPALQPKHLVAPREFAEDASARFFRSVELGEPGWLLPIDFRLRIRRKETTMVIGDDKTGKSTLVNYFLLHLAQQGAKCCIASMEMPPPVTLYNLAAQLLGTAHLPECQASLNLLARAMAWLNERFLFYSFLGIAQWRDLLETFRYAAEKDAVNCFEIDSLMRIGIPDDDYAQQGFAAEAFASFAMQTDSHLFYVCHENKSDGKGKKKARGSALWTANACNVLRIERNEDKQIKIDEKHGDIISEKNSTKPDQEWIAECETKIEELRKQWDTRLVLLGQRYPFSQQNAAKRIWFDRSCGQFREHFEDAPVNWLERWKRREKVEAE
jgi:twinkle protein